MSDASKADKGSLVTARGYGLGRFPAGRQELELRTERKRIIREAREQAEMIERDGCKWKLVRLPDGLASDYALEDEDDAA